MAPRPTPTNLHDNLHLDLIPGASEQRGPNKDVVGRCRKMGRYRSQWIASKLCLDSSHKLSIGASCRVEDLTSESLRFAKVELHIVFTGVEGMGMGLH